MYQMGCCALQSKFYMARSLKKGTVAFEDLAHGVKFMIGLRKIKYDIY